MDRVILGSIPFAVDEEDFISLLRTRPGTKGAADLAAFLREGLQEARPRAAFAVAAAHPSGHDTVEIDGVVFTSRVLRVNLEDAGPVFPFIATCGMELEEWSQTMKATLHRFWADTLMLLALGCAVSRLENLLRERLGTDALSSMNPGSLPDWPLEQQAPLFTLLGDAARAVGTGLTASMVIRPLKSVSGIYFMSGKNFTNCALCPRERCPSRRAGYDAGMYRKDFL